MNPSRRLAIVLLGIALCLQLLSSGVSHAQDGKSRRAEFLTMFARSYFPGRSGQIMIVPREYEILTSDDPSYRFMHGSPWDYDVKIPYILYGPPFIRADRYTEIATHQDLTPTLGAAMRVALPATVTGRPLRQALDATAGVPRAVVLLVLDAGRVDYLQTHAASMPALSRLKSEGAWFPNARVNYLPSATAVAHSTISTGADPRFHGIVVNTQYDHVKNEPAEVFPGKAVSTLMAPTLADMLNIQSEGRAIIYSQGGLYYAAAGLAGHGGCYWNGRPVMEANYDQGQGIWGANTDCFRLPPYLAAMNSKPLWEGVGGTWRGHDIANANDVRRTALFPKFEADAIISVIEHEAVGADEVTDLLLANLKSLDWVGHKYGPDSPEIADTLIEMDKQVGRIVEALEHKVGRGQYIVAITADHGMPPEVRSDRGGRLLEPEMLALLNRKFDPEGKLFRVYEASNSQIYVNAARMQELGVTAKQVAAFLEEQPFIYAAYPEEEVRARAESGLTAP